ncbi:MAG: YceG family protein, partial [Niameybacter sp.]
MIIASQSLLSDFLLPRAERPGNYFGHLMGMGHTQEYKDLLARLVQLANAPLHQTLIFKAGLPTFNAPESLAHFQVQAPHLDFGNLTRSPLELSRFDPLNLNIARALDMIVPHALATEHFVSEDQQNLFIAKLLLLIDTYVANVDFSKPEVPKAIFYGPIKRQECYFILLLAAIGFDTFYLNPTHDVT